ncbi:TPA: hypothetical protein ACH3X3_004373 [Trebouxia sp. C0006]
MADITANQAPNSHTPDSDEDDDAAHQVWTMRDLRILHELQKPVAVVVSGVYEDPHSAEGLQDISRVIFQNAECKKQFGLPRSRAEFVEIHKSYSETERQMQRAWILKATQGGSSHQSWMNFSNFLRPLFQGVTADGPNFICRFDSKAIRVRTLPTQVESALMHVAELDGSVTDLRVAAIHSRNPLHTFLFNSCGVLLNANASALQAFAHSHAGDAGGTGLILKTLFEEGVYPGGEEEAQSAYDDAMNAVFSLQLECHRHTQAHKSKKDGSTKWSMIEMWPMLDPVDASPAVLVKRHNITQQKHIELQLTAHQDALQKQNQELEQDSFALHEQQLRLQEEAQSLTQRLEVILHDKFQHRKHGFDSDTPIDKTLTFLQGVIGGKVPPVEMALDLFNILSESDTNLRQPVGLEDQLLQARSIDSEVGQSMLQLLQGSARGCALVPDRQGSSMSASLTNRNLTLPAGAARPYWMDNSYPTEQDGSFVPPTLTTSIEKMLLDAENNWQFDVFAFAEATPGVTLALLTFHFYKISGCISHFGLDPVKLWRYLQRVESGYQMQNPYHNSIHVASVVQMTHMLLCHGGIMQSKALSNIQLLSAYWSAAVHDFEHGGVNNDFLIKTAHPLAITYNDQSPLENHHLAAAVRLMFDPDLSYLPMSVVRSDNMLVLRSTCINMVLGTDMKKHFDIVSRFQAAFKRTPPSSAAEPSLQSASASPVQDWESIKAEDKTLVHQMVLKCADIGHLAAGLHTHKRWALQLEEEFFRQGDKEKECCLTVSPLMDRTLQGGMTRSQIGFFNIVGTPMFKAMVDLFPDAQPMLDGVIANLRQWEQSAEQAAKTS